MDTFSVVLCGIPNDFRTVSMYIPPYEAILRQFHRKVKKVHGGGSTSQTSTSWLLTGRLLILYILYKTNNKTKSNSLHVEGFERTYTKAPLVVCKVEKPKRRARPRKFRLPHSVVPPENASG